MITSLCYVIYIDEVNTFSPSGVRYLKGGYVLHSRTENRLICVLVSKLKNLNRSRGDRYSLAILLWLFFGVDSKAVCGFTFQKEIGERRRSQQVGQY